MFSCNALDTPHDFNPKMQKSMYCFTSDVGQPSIMKWSLLRFRNENCQIYESMACQKICLESLKKDLIC